MSKKVLIVYHSMGGNTKAAAEAVAAGARKVAGVEAQLMEALKAGPGDLLSCDAVAFGSGDYFSYMAGGLKDFFDRSYYPTQGQVTDKPCGVFLTHGGGGRGGDSIKGVVRSFKLRLAAPVLLVLNRPDDEATKKLMEMGETLGKIVTLGG